MKSSLAMSSCAIALITGAARAQSNGELASATKVSVVEGANAGANGSPAEASISSGQEVSGESGVQSSEPQPSPADGAVAEEADVVVTARRRSESIQKVPISIIAVTGATLKSQGIQDLKQFSSFAPGVSINNGRADGGGTTAQIFIRGVGQNDFLIPNEPGVGLYVDDVYVASSSGALNSLGDIESIEVLRGPQGTLYGKNTIGGAIRITTVKPDLDRFSGSASLALGSGPIKMLAVVATD